MGYRKKRARVLSILFMGLGQLYNRQYMKAFLFGAGEAVFLLFVLPFLSRGIHGLITLGDTPQIIENGVITQGDHSIFLLVMGILSILLLGIFVITYVLNVKDAAKVGALRDGGKKPNTFRETLGVCAEKGFPYTLLTPALVFIVFLNILPLLFGILISFTNYSGPNHLPPRNLVDWVGLQNFVNLIKIKSLSRTIGGVTAWTFVWALAASLSTYLFGLILAVLVNAKGVRIKKVWRTIFIIPWAMPSFISIFIMRILFNGQFGPINQYLSVIGLGGIPWLTDPTLAKVTCVIVNLWFGMPYYMALISGVLAGLPKDLYESARVEGAGPFQIFRKITLPMVTFATAPLVITSFGFNFNNFTLVYLLTDGNPVNANYTLAGHTDILISWIFKLTLDRQQFNIAAAIFVVIFLIISAIAIVSLRRTKSFREEDMLR